MPTVEELTEQARLYAVAAGQSASGLASSVEVVEQRKQEVAALAGAITPAAETALAAAAEASEQISLVKFEYGNWPARAEGIDEGRYWAESRILYPMLFTEFEGQVTGGGGIISEVTVFFDDYPVFGPVPLTSSVSLVTINLLAPAGTTIKVQFAGMVGSVTSAKALIRGAKN